jgi:hypothetical protein
VNTDPLNLLRDANPVVSTAPYAPGRAAALLDQAVAGAPGKPARRRTWRAATVSLGAALAVGGGGGLALAVFSQPPGTALQVLCAVGTDRTQYDPASQGMDGSTLSSMSGDPVADCAGEYEKLEGAAPPLVGYDTGQQYVAVMPADWPAPSGWSALPATFRNDPSRLELKHRLDDLIEGPESRCTTADEAEAIARRDMADLGLDGWTFQRLSQAAYADGTGGWCAKAWVGDGAEREVVIQGLEEGMWVRDDPGTNPVRRIRDALRDEVARRCLPLSEAAHVTRDVLVRNGTRLADAHIREITAAGAACTRIDFVPGGNTVVVLRGPER